MVGETPLILVVEDEAMVALDLQDMLEEAGYRAAIAATAAEVAAALLLAVPSAAVVDVRLRDGMTGPQIAQRLHELGVPVIIHSGERGAIVAVPAVAWLVKPARQDEILAAVRDAIGDNC